VFPAPAELTLGNYAGLVADEELLRSFWNTVLIAGPSTVLVVVIGAPAAYALAWIDFPGRDWVLVVTVGLLVVPIQVALIPVARLLGATGLYGSIPGVVLFQVAFGLPFAVFLLRNFFADQSSAPITVALRPAPPVRHHHRRAGQRGVPLDARAARRVLQLPALLRAGHPRGVDEMTGLARGAMARDPIRHCALSAVSASLGSPGTSRRYSHVGSCCSRRATAARCAAAADGVGRADSDAVHG